MTTPPPFREALRTWARVGLYSFGGPAGQIAVMHRILVEEKRWVDERRFLHALNFCMLLPGPEAQQLATYLGWLLHRTPGGLVAGVFFVLPGFAAVLVLSILYAGFYDTTIVQGIFFGIKPAIVAIVVHAVLRIGRRALATRALLAIAGAAFVGIFLLDIPFPFIILGAGLAGYAVSKSGTPDFAGATADPARAAAVDADAASDAAAIALPSPVPPTWRRTLRVVTFGLLLWWLPVLGVAVVAGVDSVWTRIGVFFSQVAVVTFGGAYAVLAYVAQQAVETYGWLRPGEMLDGLGMAETTPGPLIQVVQFVGFIAALREPGALDPMLAGVLGAVLTTWVTFVPCFIFIFAGAPWIERLHGRHSLNAALAGITAAVVGVILNLAVWFSVHVLFRTIHELRFPPLRLLVPEWRSLDPAALLITVGAFAALFLLRWGMLRTLGAAALAGLLYVGIA